MHESLDSSEETLCLVASTNLSRLNLPFTKRGLSDVLARAQAGPMFSHQLFSKPYPNFYTNFSVIRHGPLLSEVG
jgi:hypothetical protein